MRDVARSISVTPIRHCHLTFDTRSGSSRVAVIGVPALCLYMAKGYAAWLILVSDPHVHCHRVRVSAGVGYHNRHTVNIVVTGRGLVVRRGLEG